MAESQLKEVYTEKKNKDRENKKEGVIANLFFPLQDFQGSSH